MAYVSKPLSSSARVAFIVLGLLAAIGSVGFRISNHRTSHATGKVIYVVKHGERTNVDVEFVALDGLPYRVRSDMNPRKGVSVPVAFVGLTVEVAYNPKSPADARLAYSDNYDKGQIWFIAPIGLITAVLAATGKLKRRVKI